LSLCITESKLEKHRDVYIFGTNSFLDISYNLDVLIIGLQWLISIMIIAVQSSAAQTVVHNSRFVNLRNHGIVLQPLRSINVVTDVWSHTYGLNLTFLKDIRITPQPVCSAIPDQEIRLMCTGFSPLTQALQRMDRKVVRQLNNTISQLFNILHDTVSSSANNRSRRAWANFVSEAFRVMFGFSTEKQLESVQQSILDLRKSTAGAMDSLAIHSEKMASYMQISNQRFDRFQNALNTQQQAFDAFLSQYQKEFHETQIAQILIAQALQRVVDFSLNMQYIDNFKQAALLASHGLLTPDLLPASVLRGTLRALRRTLAKRHCMFFPLRHTPEDIYGSKDFHIWIQDNFLYITIFFPLSPMAHQLNLYKIIPTAFPLPHQPEYYTRALNLPKFVGFHDDEELFITFPDHLPQIEPSNIFYMQHSEHALLNKSR